MYRRGLRNDPWGTPYFCFASIEVWPFIQTDYIVFCFWGYRITKPPKHSNVLALCCSFNISVHCVESFWEIKEYTMANILYLVVLKFYEIPYLSNLL